MMSNNNLHNFIQRLTHVQLSDTDRQDVRAALEEHAIDNQPVKSPFTSILSPLQSVKQPALVVALVFLMVGGVSMAAEDALPGDPLYGIKVNVNEKVMALTSFSSTSEAENQSRMTSRRIAELEALAARGSLDPEVSKRLTTAISEHTRSAREHIEAASAEGETSDALSLEAELMSTLNTHSDILQDLAIASDGSRATTTAAAAAELRQAAQSKAESDVSTTVSSSQSVSVRSRDDSKTDVSPEQTSKLLERTANRLEVARQQFGENYDSFRNDAVRDSLEELLVTAAENVDAAVDRFDNEEYKEANSLLQEALTYTHEVVIIIDVRHSLELTSGRSVEDLLDNNNIATSSIATSSKGIKNTNPIDTTGPDANQSESDEQEQDSNINMNKVQTADEMLADNTSTSSAGASSSAPTAAVSSSTASTTAGTSSTSSSIVENGEGGQNLMRVWAASSDGYAKINKVLERVKETLSVSESQPRPGLLPGRSSGDEGET